MLTFLSQQTFKVRNRSNGLTALAAVHILKENNFNLLQTVTQVIGSQAFINYNELEIGEKLGEGGYGEVRKGRWLGRDVAIKFYGRKKIANKKKLQIDFIQEVDVLRQLRHPNIVLFMGVSITPQLKGLLITE